MNPNMFSRASSASRSIADVGRSVSPSTSSSSRRIRTGKNILPRKQRQTKQRRCPPETLQSLVSLHHAAASFMHDPDDVATGFDNAFQHTYSEPYYNQYDQWKSQIISSQTDGQAGLIEKPGDALMGRELAKREAMRKAPTYWRTFKKHENLWSQRNDQNSPDEMLSERERQVKEALFGTWERGGMGMKRAEPSLEGMQEWLKAKGIKIDAFAKEWEERHAVPHSGKVIEAPKDTRTDGSQVESTPLQDM